MTKFKIAIHILAVAFIAVSFLHLVLGLGADAVLSSPVTSAMMAERLLTAMNRFYGVTFSLLGICLWIASTDFARYEPILFAVLGVLSLPVSLAELLGVFTALQQNSSSALRPQIFYCHQFFIFGTGQSLTACWPGKIQAHLRRRRKLVLRVLRRSE